jgi:hypothetical protein
MADPILESLLKARLNTMCCDIFLLLNKKVEKFQLCLKTAASLFAFSCMTFLIKTVKILTTLGLGPVAVFTKIHFLNL